MRYTEKQLVQEEQYKLPYHYIPSRDDEHFKPFLHWSWGINYLLSTEFLVERIIMEDFDSLIDVGCGDGRFIRELSKRIKEKKLMGVDLSQRAINLAKALNPGLEFRRLDILQNNLINDFGIVTLIEVLEHISLEQVPSFIESIAHLQSPGGRLYLTVPHNNKSVQKKHFQHFDSISLERYLNPFYEVQEYIFFDKKKPNLTRILRGIMKNRFFILRHSETLDAIYRFYKNNLFLCAESECSRFCVVAKRKQD